MRYTRSVKLLLIVILAMAPVAVMPSIATADAQNERSDLVRLVHELDQLDALIARAEGNSASAQRVRFQYAWLRADLEKVKAGVREYLETSPTSPRVPPPLAGDYIR